MSQCQFSRRSSSGSALNPGSVVRTSFVLLACLLVCVLALAQSTTEGAISGTVADNTGAVVPNAAIVVHNNSTNAEQKVTSGAAGQYRVGNLTPSIYTVTVTAAGFALVQVAAGHRQRGHGD